jgi:predicted DNA-binding transcriptional regulator AlpA
MTDRLLTTRDVATFLGLSRETVTARTTPLSGTSRFSLEPVLERGELVAR